jgi:hypothetical protein
LIKDLVLAGDSPKLNRNTRNCLGNPVIRAYSRRPAMLLRDRIPARKSYKSLLWFLTAAFMLLTGAQLFGQLEAGKISGTVRDTSGAVVPGVSWGLSNHAAERNR